MGLYKKLRKYITGKRMTWPVPFRKGIPTRDVFFRDPYVTTTNDGYLMTGTVYHLNYNDSDMCLCYKSNDLQSWDGPEKLVDGKALPGKFFDFWAPEIHRVGDKYALLITLRPDGGKRGVYMFVSDRPDGGYLPAARLTPEDQNCLDGTLYVDKDNIYFAYCREYIDVSDGEIRCAKLSKDAFRPCDGDFPCIAGESKLLFKGSANRICPTRSRYKVTDGPFYFTYGDDLFLLWSTHLRRGRYALLLARSLDGSPDGAFEQCGVLYGNDGGHAMVFTDKVGERRLALHSPNARTVFSGKFEHPHFILLDKLIDGMKNK